jgi:hypothetical protein
MAGVEQMSSAYLPLDGRKRSLKYNELVHTFQSARSLARIQVNTSSAVLELHNEGSSELAIGSMICSALMLVVTVLFGIKLTTYEASMSAVLFLKSLKLIWPAC